MRFPMALLDSEILVYGHLVALAAFIFFVLAFVACKSSHPNPKASAWIITTIASCVAALASVPFMSGYLATGGNITGVPMLEMLAKGVNRMFQGYLLADLAAGAIWYPKLIDPFTGWGHHIAYTCIVEVIIRREMAHLFCLCLTMELPTFILGIGILYPRLRSDSLFAITFLSTRIMLHLVLLKDFLANPYQGSYIPAGLLICAFPLHAMWFTNCIKGMLRRRRAKLIGNSQASVPIIAQLPDISCSKTPVQSHTPGPVPVAVSRMAPIPAPLLARSLSILARQRATRLRIRAEAKRALLQLQTKLHNLPVPNREVVFDYVGLGRGASVPVYRQAEFARREQKTLRRRMVDVGSGTGVVVPVY